MTALKGMLVVLLLVPAQPATAQNTALTPGLDSIARSALNTMKIPGMSIAVVRGTDTLLFKGYGSADLENDVAAVTQTVYRIGSITKQFTAAAILRLAEQERLNLNDTLQHFFPNYATKGNRITIRHLLNHTSGIRSFTSMGARWERLERLDVAADSMIALFSSEPFDFQPGAEYRYNNSGYFLLGAIIEKISGKKYGDFLHDEFFQPLGLSNTYYCDQAPIIKHRAQGYRPLPDGGWRNAPPLSMTQPFAAGALCSTIGDLVTWTHALHAGRVIKETSLRRMLAGEKLNDGNILDYGYGIGLANLDGRREFSHSGGINGFNSFLAFYPDENLTVAVLTNSDASNPTVLGKQLARHALGVPAFKPRDLALTATQLGRVTGMYFQGEMQIRVTSENGRIYWSFPGIPKPERLFAQGAGVFVPESDIDVRITFSPAAANAQQLTVTQGGQTVLRARRAAR